MYYAIMYIPWSVLHLAFTGTNAIVHGTKSQSTTSNDTHNIEIHLCSFNVVDGEVSTRLNMILKVCKINQKQCGKPLEA